MNSEDNFSEEPHSPIPVLTPQKLAALFGISRSSLFIRGIVLLLFGLVLWIHPVKVMMTITMVIGAYILIEGIVLLIGGLRLKASTRGWFVLNALLGILLGAFALFSPLVVDKALIVIIGIWELLGGCRELFYPVKSGSGRFWTVISGLLSIIIGLVFIIPPLAGIMVVAWLTSLLLFISGVSVVATALMIR